MKNKRAALCLLILVCWTWGGGFASAQSDADHWVFPGEYERHEAMWMLWPVFENKAGFPSTEPIGEMIRAMHGHVRVNLGVQDADDEASARALLTSSSVPLDHVHFLRIEHGDIWARDMGPQFTRSRSGALRVNDWNFNMWGNEEPDSEFSRLEERFDRAAADAIGVPIVDARPGPITGVRMIHEGGSATHNGHGTMIAVESVVMQRNLGPNRFCGGQSPVTDYGQPNTYAPSSDWPACRALVENEYRRMLGAEKVIWVPTGIIEDTGTFRGALASHLQVPELDGVAIPHAGVYTLFTTNGHPDEFVRFVDANTVVLAEETLPRASPTTAVERLTDWLRARNHERLQRVERILATETTASGDPIRILRIPMPVITLEAFVPGDGIYDYYSTYERWEDGTRLPEVMLGVWPASYVNYVPTNGLVLVPKFWKPGRADESRRRDEQARRVLQAAFPGRELVQVFSENINRGGGGMNCITQQQPVHDAFAQRCLPSGGARSPR